MKDNFKASLIFLNLLFLIALAFLSGPACVQGSDNSSDDNSYEGSYSKEDEDAFCNKLTDSAQKTECNTILATGDLYRCTLDCMKKPNLESQFACVKKANSCELYNELLGFCYTEFVKTVKNASSDKEKTDATYTLQYCFADVDDVCDRDVQTDPCLEKSEENTTCDPSFENCP